MSESRKPENRHAYYLANREKWTRYRRQQTERQPLYTVWHSMLRRTGFRPGATTHDIKNYIGRGITVCADWQIYANFEAWSLANGWRRGLQIDRINNGGNYEPSNCRFISAKRNQRNRRNTALVMFKGVTMPLADAYELAKCPLPYDLVRNRVRRNKWPIDRALTEPAMGPKPYLAIAIKTEAELFNMGGGNG